MRLGDGVLGEVFNSFVADCRMTAIFSIRQARSYVFEIVLE